MICHGYKPSSYESLLGNEIRIAILRLHTSAFAPVTPRGSLDPIIITASAPATVTVAVSFLPFTQLPRCLGLGSPGKHLVCLFFYPS